ncbi:mitofusin-1-like isoform X2 [Mya arenaria]|uniref:mitofusin-1-like isoform X2 n=1 Tax=Mya arenaria TaxID=6604 RepID=UPI0022DF3632|nr:mitofusin-1-like isoform X2 [Mya arenaria]XP_052759724.1 mitofusin-1-like isoform X2 [Mya arenaria]
MENPDHRGSGDAGVGHRSIGHGRNGNGRMSPNSPLKRFGQAKKAINDIFRDVLAFINEADNFVEGIATGGYLEVVSYQDQVKEYRENVCGIMVVLARDCMKVVFFGRTSNGKSTTINAMLGEKILPTGIGHTTNCFLQVEGSDSTEGYLLTEEEPENRKSLQSIKQLASALSNVKLKENSLIRILWPKSKCRLLREEVVLVDSPGIDMTPDLDRWIDKICLDADVFVLVSNAESTLLQTEKNFFHKVSARLSKPNIFILQNRWDISAFEDDVDEVKQQHLERNLQFLCSELNVMDKQEGEERVFFVSSREALDSRLKKQRIPMPTDIHQKGYLERQITFAKFERVFEECISKTAVKTKFEQHTNRGKNITTELRSLMEKMLRTSQEQYERVINERREKADKLNYMKTQLTLLTTEIKDKIKNTVEYVENKVTMTIKDEIGRLSILVDEFHRIQPFRTDQKSLDTYKQELHEHIENGLRKNIQSRCSATLRSALETTQHEMTGRLSALLPEEAQQQINTVMPRRDFEIAYRLNCRGVCENFKEDIAFHFTLRIPALSKLFDVEADPDNAKMLFNLVTSVINIKESTALGVVLAVGILCYGGLYCFERMHWTSKAKERAFKAQYVDYASSNLNLIVDSTSSNCSYQVQHELSSTFDRLCSVADITKRKLEDEIKQMDIVISQLRDISAKSETYRNKADELDKALDNFKEQFLNTPTSGV